MTKRDKPRILCVDDEPMVLEGISDMLGRTFDVHTAGSGLQGIDAIRDGGSFAVVMSDMRMPIMDGAAFLSKVREIAPDSTRLLLTGQADLDAAIRAINQGQLFRFLSKPIEPESLEQVMHDAVAQHRLVSAERELLEQTLNQSFRMMLDVVDLVAAGDTTSTRIDQVARHLADVTNHPAPWAVEAAAIMSSVGEAAVGSDEPSSSVRFETAIELITNIPRMEPVIALLDAARDGTSDGQIVTAASLLAAAFAAGSNPDTAAAQLRAVVGMDPSLVEAARSIEIGTRQLEPTAVSLRELRIGMRTAEPILSVTGVMILGAGQEITQPVLLRLNSMASGIGIQEPCVVLS